ncbi:MAG TPA: Wadjet anti-phage system protein JetA family protein [Bacilli bacterium]
MNLFEVIPEGLFQLLTGANRKLYAEALLLLYEHSQRERFGIRYEVMRDLLQELLETQSDAGMPMALEEDEPAAAEEAGQVTLEDYARVQANAMLRRLERLKWIDVETRSQFEAYIVLPHYASRLIGVFQELCEARTVEYQRFAFVTYQLLTGEEAKLRPCFAVMEAAQVTKQFRQELIALYNNMKHHMESVVQKTSIREVLDHHFETYKSQIVDKSYHRLKTSDHVARYRFQILRTVQQWLLDRELLQEAAMDGVKSELYGTAEEAEHAVREALFFIEETYVGLEEIFYQIDVRHNQYLRASYDRARYLSQQFAGLDRRLARLIEQLGKETQESEFALFTLCQVRGWSEQSLYAPRRRKAAHQPEKHVTIPIPEHVMEELRQRNIEKMRKAITRKKVDHYVLSRMGDRKRMEIAELAPRNAEEFIMLGYVYLYGSDGGSRFRLDRSAGRPVVRIGGYRFHNHDIVRAQQGGRMP